MSSLAEQLASLLSSVDLRAEVLSLVRQVPRGCVTTYGELARALGDEKSRSARWLGEFLKDHPHTHDCPCHRVVRATGDIGLHVSGDPNCKAALLASEGVEVANGHVNLDRVWKDFDSTRPLDRLRAFQLTLAGRVRNDESTLSPRTIGAVDVAYPEPGLARGAYVLLNADSLNLIEEFAIEMPVAFPYIPSYLTFRELPLLLELVRQARERNLLGDVLMVDGNGQLHPWRAGIATCLGVIADHPTIGIGKSLLCGKVDAVAAQAGGIRPVRDGDDVIGMSVRNVYVSVGNRIALAAAASIVERSYAKHRFPEPIWHADRRTKIAPRRVVGEIRPTPTGDSA